MISIEFQDGLARAGIAKLPNGSFATPVFMPVGTRASVRAVPVGEIEAIGAEIILANTYHLMLRPGADLIAEMGGLHRFTSWEGSILTDSGGFQVFSLGARYGEEGVSFKSVYDGSSHLLTPERAVEVQEQLGSDIQMVLDVCSALPASSEQLRHAAELTRRWGDRALAARKREDQVIFGIVQGGDDPDLRVESARWATASGFDGYAIGGLSVGEPRRERNIALQAALSELPETLPRYLMGVGDPVGIVDAVSMGVDMFDCVLPTRLARHGTLLTAGGRLNIKRAEFARDIDPVEAGCPCGTCRRYSRGYLRHLFASSDPVAMTLASVHNLSWMHGFVGKMREAIVQGEMESFAKGIYRAWGAEE